MSQRRRITQRMVPSKQFPHRGSDSMHRKMPINLKLSGQGPCCARTNILCQHDQIHCLRSRNLPWQTWSFGGSLVQLTPQRRKVCCHRHDTPTSKISSRPHLLPHDVHPHRRHAQDSTSPQSDPRSKRHIPIQHPKRWCPPHCDPARHNPIQPKKDR